MIKLDNPLPKVLRDTKKLSNFYKEYNLVPYAGTDTVSSHKFLKMLYELYDLAPSKNACINDLKHFIFEGEYDVVEAPKNRLKIKEKKEVSSSEVDRYVTAFSDAGVLIGDLIDEMKEVYTNYKVAGDGYIFVKGVKIGKTFRFTFDSIHPMDAMFLNTAEGEPKAIVVSNSFFTGAFEDEPKLIRVYPDFLPINGGFETVFHFKNKRGFGRFYGQPDTLPAFLPEIIEYAVLMLTGKIAFSENVSKVIFGFERESTGQNVLNSSNPDFDKFVKDLRKKITAKGRIQEAEGIGIFDIPNGGKFPEMYEIKVNRDTKFFEFVKDAMSDYIFSQHRWSKLINGFERAPGSIGGNVLKDEYDQKNRYVVQPLQRAWEGKLKVVLDAMLRFMGKEDLSKYKVEFEDKITPYVASFSDQQQKINPDEPENDLTGNRSSGTGENT